MHHFNGGRCGWGATTKGHTMATTLPGCTVSTPTGRIRLPNGEYITVTQRADGTWRLTPEKIADFVATEYANTNAVPDGGGAADG